MPDWTPTQRPPRRPIEHAEESLVNAILDNHYAPGDTLPAERALATLLGVTRPTLREALRRLERDGWVTIQQGKSTRVNDFWKEGGPHILTAIVNSGNGLPRGFVTHLLEVRQQLAPAYTGAAVEREAGQVAALAAGHRALADTAEAYAPYDWHLHHSLTLLSGNPVYTLILNGFAGFYESAARRYFEPPAARAASRDFYQALENAALAADRPTAERLSHEVMGRSIELWQEMRAEEEHRP